jgi:hypothetical protein
MGILTSRVRSESNAAIAEPDFAELSRSHATASSGTPTTRTYNKDKFKLGAFVMGRSGGFRSSRTERQLQPH